MSADLSWLEAAVIGLLQGVSELFPVSSLGHSILIPAIVEAAGRGTWTSAPRSRPTSRSSSASTWRPAIG